MRRMQNYLRHMLAARRRKQYKIQNPEERMGGGISLFIIS
jgi:hypothetical protein